MKEQTPTSAKRKPYDSDLTDAQWGVLELMPPPKRRGRPRKTDLREVVNALIYTLHSGCSRRMLPYDLPPWQTVLPASERGSPTESSSASTTPSAPKSADPTDETPSRARRS